MISVVIPTYQHATTIARCLDSIFDQTEQAMEIIVVDDGSTDETAEVLKPFANRVTLIRQENRGASAARNRGFDASRGELVIFCDADVLMRRDMLQRMKAALEAHPEAAYAYSAFRFGWKTFSSYPFSADRLRQMNFITTTTLIRRQDFPRFDETLRRFQDWDLWLTILEQGKGGIFIPEMLFQIENPRQRKGEISLFGQTPSPWRPSIVYRLPWHLIGWKPAVVAKYEAAREQIKRKHALC